VAEAVVVVLALQLLEVTEVRGEEATKVVLAVQEILHLHHHHKAMTVLLA
jgi:hypothetical protein